ncbi:PLP-dependent aminotransferase family protein [Paenibacillus sp. GSMTC-2017]|uniref:aminotransferase-like domain-containing protein n=1 Tax=Paenibacillus sp. GSMTC-2017 TaxID=2794350 RepID=UPI0018D90979|nr:PLP-dependent aminotransferase family protein [Paenibacillus sp. GSMTC-2017]MBH5318348.1 PLP-dependent aminotransferase family protein [Paenibacillus sp. GSMTC-2017]
MKRYVLILADINQKINDGTYKPGQKLPSVRLASEHYQCSTSTIVRVYAELEKEHAIYSIAQSGYYVVERGEARCDDKEVSVINLSSALPDINVFPYLDFQHCLNKAIDVYRHQLFTYGDSKGLDKLRHTLVSHLANDQVFANKTNIFVTSGIQPVLELLAKMPFPNGKSVILVEQPSYDIYLRFLEMEGLNVSGIERTANGINLKELERRFKNDDIKFFYTMSRYHNPLGTSYSKEDRKTIARLASKYDVYVVEDDYMADLGEERGFEPIYAYNSTSHIIYLKSFSKIVFPGLRLGATVIPDGLLEKFQTARSYPDTSLLSQAALEVYINNGMYERHKRKIGLQYESRISILNDAVNRYNKEGVIEISQIKSGIYVQFKLPIKVNLERLMKRLKEKNITVRTGKDFYLTEYLERQKFVRVSISQAQPEQIELGIKTIIEEVKRLSNQD